MSLLISESVTEPLIAAQVKAWAKIENADEDSLITSLITSCRREIESYTKHALIAQVWQSTYIAEKGIKAFYSPRMKASSLTFTVDNVANTDYVFNVDTGKLRLNNAYVGDESLVITWTIGTTLSSLAPLLQALLDLVTYRFFNRGVSDMPQVVSSVLSQYRIYNV